MRAAHIILVCSIIVLFAGFVFAVLAVTRTFDYPHSWPSPFGIIFLGLAGLAVGGIILEKGGKDGKTK